MAINSLSASSYGLSGMVSGMNTQEMVEKMLSGTQSKIDKAGQKKTVLQYKQQMYRDVATKLKTLQSSYLSFTSKTNLLSSSFYNTMTTNITPPSGTSAAFSVSASTSANVGNVIMNNIKQLATAQTSKTQVDASSDVVAQLDSSVAQRLVNQYRGGNATMTIKVGENDSVSFANAPELFGGKSQSEIVAIINQKFQDENVGAEARFVNNKLQITATNENDYIVVQGNQITKSSLGMKMFGEVSSLSGKGVFEAEIDSDKYFPSIEVNLDGRQQTIRLDLNALQKFASGQGADDLEASIQKQLTRAFGAAVTVELDNGALKFDVREKSQKFTITGNSVEMTALGLKSGISNKLNTNMALKDLNFATQLQGDQHTFSINGVEFSYNSSATLGTIINDINNSKAGVKISYVESEDRFMIQRSETGAGSTEELGDIIKQSSGNLMSVMFGSAGGNEVAGRGVSQQLVGAAFEQSEIAYGGVYTFNVNGKDYSFEIPWKSGDGMITKSYLASTLNSGFASTFGTMADGRQAITVELNDDGGLTITANNEDLVLKTLEKHVDTNKSTLGFTPGSKTLATAGSTLEDAGISFGTDGKINIKIGGGIDFDIATADLPDNLTMEDLAQLINDKIEAAMPAGTDPLPKVEFDKQTAAFRVMGVDIPMEINLVGATDGTSKKLDNLFGQDNLKVNQPAVTYDDGQGNTTASILKQTDAGQNAIFTLNGNEMQRSSNSFTVDGLTFTLHSTTHIDQSNTDPNAPSNAFHGPTNVSVTRDTEKIVEGLQEFLKLYNETMDYLYDLYKADATYKDYAPLTTAQKESMSDREIELWEEKSKEGLLRNDRTIEGIITQMRQAMYSKPEGSSIAIYDLGIATSFYSNDGNLNADSIDKMREAIEKDPEAVRKLFAGDGGLMEQLNDILNNATKSSYGSPGTLVAMAGSNALDTTSTIYKQIKEIDNQLSTLETRYWNEYNRYWKQFNSMEQLIQQMNSQSSWLSQLGS